MFKFKVSVPLLLNCIALAIMFPNSDSFQDWKLWLVLILISSATHIAHFNGRAEVLSKRKGE